MLPTVLAKHHCIIVLQIIISMAPIERSQCSCDDMTSIDTALHLASFRQDEEMIDLLLGFGADPVQQNALGHIAWHSKNDFEVKLPIATLHFDTKSPFSIAKMAPEQTKEEIAYPGLADLELYLASGNGVEMEKKTQRESHLISGNNVGTYFCFGEQEEKTL
ncbi:hypothetical protein LEN26_020325 [Aphanomyces euteiches]|nr:hypothetical protein LEN26_020325 [Aphanomyces euteiches]KAH9113165.1 hypothetical protein AeMF1_012604 [Aphanomyces euteiches]KAH9185573.1 hypothetical protein AeNC1_012450 [Aphanomyces euteiches]